MPNGHKITTETILGTTVDVYVGRDGRFRAEVVGDDLVADSLDGLKDQARRVIKKSKANIRIPVTLFNYGKGDARWSRRHGDGPARGLVDCYFRGQNSRTGAYLLQDLQGKKFDVDSYIGRDCMARRFTPDQAERYLALTKAADESRAALEAFEEQVTVQPGDLIDEVNQQAEAAPEPVVVEGESGVTVTSMGDGTTVIEDPTTGE